MCVEVWEQLVFRRWDESSTCASKGRAFSQECGLGSRNLGESGARGDAVDLEIISARRSHPRRGISPLLMTRRSPLDASNVQV